MVTVFLVKVLQLQVEVGRQLVSSSPWWLSWQWLLLLHGSSTREKEGKDIIFLQLSTKVLGHCLFVLSTVNSFLTFLTCRQYVMKLVVRFFGSKASEPVRYHKVCGHRYLVEIVNYFLFSLSNTAANSKSRRNCSLGGGEWGGRGRGGGRGGGGRERDRRGGRREGSKWWRWRAIKLIMWCFE